MLKLLRVKDKRYSLPIFCPDGTQAVVRSLDSLDLTKAGVEGIVVNTFHLKLELERGLLKRFGGVKKLMNFNGLVISDSGGFQVMSLIYKKGQGKINHSGIVFYSGGAKKPRQELFTPEESIQLQFALGADIMVCLDDCPPSDASEKQVEQSVFRTIEWAKRSKQEFEKQLNKAKVRPLLFAVIQGNDSKRLRKLCAEELIKIGFDGYAFGGWPMKKERLNEATLRYVAELMPDNLPKYALGVGKPADIVKCFRWGYTIFDCVLPTRDARHQRLYLFTEEPNRAINAKNPERGFGFLDIGKRRCSLNPQPISRFCDCHTCKNYSQAYLYHLFKINDPTAFRLATIHNLRTYAKVIEVLRKAA